jgi:hypothetical protein
LFVNRKYFLYRMLRLAELSRELNGKRGTQADVEVSYDHRTTKPVTTARLDQ